MLLNISIHLRELFTNLGLFSEEDQSFCKQIVLAQNNAQYYPYNSDDEKYESLSYFDKEQLNHLKPDAIFVLENRPFILFYDLTGVAKDDIRFKIAKKDTWVYDTSPIVIILTDAGTEVLNAFSYNRKDGIKGEVWDEEKVKEVFSRLALMSGESWKRWQNEQYTKIQKKNQAGRFNDTLLSNIRVLRDKLVEGKEENNPLLGKEREATTFLLRLLFIRYLIDKQVDIKEHILGDSIAEKRDYFHKVIICDYERLKALFSYINESWMNGDLFKMEIKPSDKQLKELSIIFTGKAKEIDSLQLTFDFYFDIFDFSIIPVETISGIYESVLNKEARKKNAAVYTPPFLVEYILSETLDKKLATNPTPVILDPAMGSGIFLVQAFRHIIYKNKEFAAISADNFIERATFLKKAVSSCIFGIDIDESAVNVAAFSLYIAILDFLRPVEIAQIQLPNLISKNLFYNDFFNEENTGILFKHEAPKWHYQDFNEELQQKMFDFIVGNPPWKRHSFEKEENKINYFEKYKNKIKRSRHISGHEIAQGFLYRALDFCQKDTQCALIVTSKAFHNGEAIKFKEQFLSKVLLQQFMDLSPVRRLIFNTSDTSEKGAIGPAAIVIYQKSENEVAAKSNLVKHISVKSNIFLKYFRTLVIDKMVDEKKVRQSNFINYKWMFKVALYGSGLDFTFLKRLQKDNKTISDYIDNKTIFKGDGIKKLTEKAREKYKPKKGWTKFDEIAQIPIIELEQINSFFSQIEEKNKPTEADLWVKSGAEIEQYMGGHRILFTPRAKNETELTISYFERDVVYREKVLGIATTEKIQNLQAIFALVQSDLYTYYQYLSAASWGVYIPEVAQKEYLAFPFSNKIDTYVKVLSKYVEELIASHKSNYFEIDNYITNFRKDINKIINEIYHISPQEQDLINYVLEVSRYQFQDGKQQKFLRKPNPKDLEKYAQVFVDYFGQLFDGSDNEYFKATYYEMDYFVAMRFEIVAEKTNAFPVKGNAKNEKEIFSILSKSTSLVKETDDIFLRKVVKGFDYKSFYIIKPKEYKSWHPAIAHLDVEEFDEAMIAGELARMKEGGVVYGR